VLVDSAQTVGIFLLAVTPYNITNSNSTGAKLASGNASHYEVTVEIPTPSDTAAPNISCTPPTDSVWYGIDVVVPCTASDLESGLADPADANFALTTNVASGDETAGASTDSHEVCDNKGNCATAGPYSFMVDKKGPAVSCAAADGAWHAGDVSIVCTAVDGGSGLGSPADASFSLSTSVAVGTETANASTGTRVIADAVGNTSTAGPVSGNKVDKKMPQLASCDVPGGLWHASNVTLYCHYTDGGSGPTNQDVALSTNVATGFESDNAVASAGGAKACDVVGNCANSPADITGNMVDKKGPVVSCAAADGVWHASDVSIACTAIDGGSGLASPADASFSLSTSVAGGTETANATTGTHDVADAVGNTSTAGPISGNMVDKKAPQLSVSGCDSPDGLWHADDVILYCSYTDGGSGPATQTVALTTSVVDGTETDNAVASAGGDQACDNVGNCADSPADIGGNMVDKKAPTNIAFVGGGINDGDSFYFGFVPEGPTGCTADDGGSGLASCDVTGYDTSVGTHTLTATATDNVGNSDTTTMSYEVLAWTLKGFYQPVDMNGVFNTVKNGSTVPFKFEIFAGPLELTDVADVQSLKAVHIACDADAPRDAIEMTATGGTSLRYDTTAGQFIYNWKTPLKPTYCYEVTMTTLDGSFLQAFFKLK